MSSDNEKLVLKNDQKISFFVAFYFIASAANATMKVTLPIAESMYSLVSLFWGILIVFFMLKALNPVLRRSSAILRKSYIIFAILYIISIVMWMYRGEPVWSLFMSTGFLTFAWWIPVGVYSASVVNKDVLYNVLLKASYIISGILFLNLLFHTSDTVDGAVEYDMFFGFAMITPTLFHINELFKQRKSGLAIIVVVEILALVLYANRGILLSLAFFLIYKFFFAKKKKTSSVYKVIFVVLCIAFVVFNEAVVTGLASIFSQYGLQSRTLEMARENNLSDSSGRLEFWTNCFQMIGEKPIFGWGLGGEFVTLGQRLHNVFGGDLGMASAHNGVVQLIVELGIMGGLYATYLFVKPVFGIKRISDTFVKDLILIYFSSYGITRLISADGFYYAPQVAVYFYLFYYYNHCRLESTN